MRLITVIEDSCGNSDCAYEHGLCIYIETDNHKFLLDTGASCAFADNLKILGIDICNIDTVVLSHGHYDHSGGILKFIENNDRAKIYMQRNVAGDYYNGERYIGIDKKILEAPNVCLLDGDYKIDEELFLFTGITGRRLWPKSNKTLNKVLQGIKVQDDFSHEQCMVVTQGEKNILLSGCAHNGILNILDKYKSLYNKMPDMVISGFHMMKKSEYEEDEILNIEQTAKQLKKMNTIFYTGHCTGQRAYDIMHSIMGKQLRQLHSGEQILLDF